ncbi:MAG: L-histidine N(alpha)-methyltransferase [Sphingobium sp.]|nr:L-histidine N(alpha)-methyltransferase [Sphingobium sp.]
MAVHAALKLVEHDPDGVDLAFRADVLRGLSERQKAVPARWFYDMAGSELFEQITRLEEYYPTAVETGLLERHGRDIARLVGPNRAVVEFGSGSSVKTPLLLREVAAAAYVPLDISGDFLRQSCDELAAKFPDLPIVPVEADFMRPVTLPDCVRHMDMLGFFPGSTIGNMVPATAVDLLRSMRETLGDRSQLLIGADRVKDVGRLIAAYDDAQGVTARFNLNLIDRINRELAADIPPASFRHVARWNDDWGRIEMHLEALEDLAFTVSGQSFEICAGETIHTENSHKYTPNQVRLLLQAAGWTPRHFWTDDAEDFLIVLADATEPRSAP